MVQSMLSGHSGSLTTVHANSALDSLIRLETLSLMSDVDIPVYVARAQVASAINLVVQLSRFTEDGSRKITSIDEVVGLDANNQYQVRNLFNIQMQGKTDAGKLIAKLQPSGELPTFADEPLQHGMEDRISTSRPLWKPLKK